MMVEIIVITQSRQEGVEVTENGLRIKIKGKAIEGKANQRLIKILAQHFDRASNNVMIKQGLRSRHKLIEIIE